MRRFVDRTEAGQRLGDELAGYALPYPIVLGLPRGGVPIGFEIAQALHAPLDVLIVRKLGVPWEPELAMGAIAGDAFQLVDQRMIAHLGVSSDEVNKVVAAERAEAQRSEIEYRHAKPAPDLRSRTVILADDGLATGSTMLVAIECARSQGPAGIVVASPVGSREACDRIAKAADIVVCLARPKRFRAVGEWYTDFRQTTDAEVHRLLSLNQQQTARGFKAPERMGPSRHSSRH